MFDLVYTVVTLTVAVVIAVVAYARGYSSGYNNGYVEAVGDFSDGDWKDAVRDHLRKNRRS